MQPTKTTLVSSRPQKRRAERETKSERTAPTTNDAGQGLGAGPVEAVHRGQLRPQVFHRAAQAHQDAVPRAARRGVPQPARRAQPRRRSSQLQVGEVLRRAPDAQGMGAVPRAEETPRRGGHARRVRARHGQDRARRGVPSDARARNGGGRAGRRRQVVRPARLEARLRADAVANGDRGRSTRARRDRHAQRGDSRAARAEGAQVSRVRAVPGTRRREPVRSETANRASTPPSQGWTSARSPTRRTRRGER